jgi:hypothetical protein
MPQMLESLLSNLRTMMGMCDLTDLKLITVRIEDLGIVVLNKTEKGIWCGCFVSQAQLNYYPSPYQKL